MRRAHRELGKIRVSVKKKRDPGTAASALASPAGGQIPLVWQGHAGAAGSLKIKLRHQNVAAGRTLCEAFGKTGKALICEDEMSF